MLRLMDQDSAIDAKVVKISTNADIKVELPAVVGQSSLPMSGKYKIKCETPDGQISYTPSIEYKDDLQKVTWYVMDYCKGMYDKL